MDAYNYQALQKQAPVLRTGLGLQIDHTPKVLFVDIMRLAAMHKCFLVALLRCLEALARCSVLTVSCGFERSALSLILFQITVIHSEANMKRCVSLLSHFLDQIYVQCSINIFFFKGFCCMQHLHTFVTRCAWNGGLYMPLGNSLFWECLLGGVYVPCII